MKIQFPDDDIRNHDDRTGKYHNNILEVPSMRTTIICQRMKKSQRNNEDNLDALAAAQEEAAAALASLVAANRALRDACEKQHQVRMSRGYFPQQQGNAIVPTGGRNEHSSSAAVHTGLHSVHNSQGNQVRKREHMLLMTTESRRMYFEVDVERVVPHFSTPEVGRHHRCCCISAWKH